MPHIVNGKSTGVGDHVHYTAHDGRKHKLSIKTIANDQVDLEGEVDGITKSFTSVPHSISRSAHTWDHFSEETEEN